MHERLALVTDDESEGENLRNLATLLTYTDRTDEARTILDEAFEKFKQLHGDDQNADVATVINALGNLERTVGNLDAAKKHYERALEIHRQVLPPNHPFIPIDLRNLAGLLEEMGDSETAEKMLHEAIASQREVVDQHPQLAESLESLGTLLNHQGRFAEAEEAVLEALEIARQAFPEDHPKIRRYMTTLGLAYSASGRVDKALQAHRAVLERDLRQDDPEDLVISYNNVAHCLMELDQPAEAELMFRKAVRLARQHSPDGSRELAMCIQNLGRCLQRMQRLEEAVELFEQSLDVRRKLYGQSHSQIANSLNSLGSIYAEMGDYDRAERLKRIAVEMYSELLGPEHLYTAITRGGLAQVLYQQRKLEESERLFRASLAKLVSSFGELHARTLKQRAYYGRTLADLQKWQAARTQLAAALENGMVDDGSHVLDGSLRAKTQVWMAKVLTQLAEFEQAEPLLLEAERYLAEHDEGASDSDNPVPALVKLYEAWHAAEPDAGYGEQAGQWRERLESAP